MFTIDTFINTIKADIITSCEKYGIKYPSCVIAHAINESNKGNSKLATYNNLFGMKKSKSWQGKTVDFFSNEEINGKLIKKKSTFKVYKSFSEGINDYCKLITGSYYKSRCHLEQAKTTQDFLRRLMIVFCTSTTQADTCENIINKYNLRQYDNTNITNNTPIDINIVVRDVINGKYGNGKIRQENIEKLGLNYREIQNLVNKIMV